MRGQAIDAAVNALARERDGVLSSQTLHALGVSPYAIRSRIAVGTWVRIGRAIVIPGAHDDEDLHQARILQCNSSPTGLVSGPIAARLRGWDIPGAELIVAESTHRRASLDGVIVVRRPTDDFAVRPFGLRLARPLDALGDTLVSVHWRRACAILDHAFQRRMVGLADLQLLVDTRSGRGSRGATQLRRLLRRMSTGSKSEAEQRMAVLLKRSATGPWIANHTLNDPRGAPFAELDFAHLGLRIAIEVDGHAFHSDRNAFESDRRRQNALVLDGWLVLRFTWDQIVNDPAGVIATVVAAVTSRARVLRAEPAAGLHLLPEERR